MSSLFYHLSTWVWDLMYRLRNDRSQFGEQNFLKQYLPKELSNVGYIDIGAHTPVKCSNSYFLYRAGAVGVAVDPISTFTLHWKIWRPRDLFLTKAVVGLDDESDGFISFYRANRRRELMSTTSLELRDALTATGISFVADKVAVIKIDTVLREFNEFFNRAPTIVLIDVEGMDAELVDSIDRIDNIELLPKFIFFEELVKPSENVSLSKYQMIARFTPQNETGVSSILYKIKAVL